MRGIGLVSLVLLIGCTQVTYTPWQDVAKNQCVTAKIWPSWYAAEVSTTCLRNGRAVDVPTQHTDAAMVGGIAIGLGSLVGALIALL